MKKSQFVALVLSGVANAPSQALGVQGTDPGVLPLMIKMTQCQAKMTTPHSKVATSLL
jgi:hypothetical protein